MKELQHVTLGFTSPGIIMGDGPSIIHLTSLRQTRNLINTLYRHHRTFDQYPLPTSPIPTDWHVMTSDWDDYDVWCDLPYFHNGTVHERNTTHDNSIHNRGWTWQICGGVRSVFHTMRILDNMGSPQHGVNIFEDNRSTIVICTNNMSPGNSRTKYVDLKIKWL
jgi:hypothetical protein